MGIIRNAVQEYKEAKVEVWGFLEETGAVDAPFAQTKKERSDIAQLGHMLICSGAVLAASGVAIEAVPVEAGLVPRLVVLAGAGIASIGGLVRLVD